MDADIHNLLNSGASNSAKMIYICDYCGNEYETKVNCYVTNKKRNILMRDCCPSCIPKKLFDLCWVEHKVSSYASLEETQRKREETCLKKYGVTTALLNDDVKVKTIKTNMEKYGYKHAPASPEIQRKSRETLLKRNKVPTSKQQKEIYNFLKCKNYNCLLNYQFENYVLDIALFINNQKINIEYDGWYWHQHKKESDEKRNIILINNDWKIIRIQSGTLLPTEKQLLEAIEILCNTKQEIFYISLNDWKENYNNESEEINYGKKL